MNSEAHPTTGVLSGIELTDITYPPRVSSSTPAFSPPKDWSACSKTIFIQLLADTPAERNYLVIVRIFVLFPVIQLLHQRVGHCASVTVPAGYLSAPLLPLPCRWPGRLNYSWARLPGRA